MSDDVILEVAGERLAGWESVQIVSSVAQAASQFAVAVTKDYPGGRKVRPGDAVTVKIGNDVVLTGYADKCPVSFSGTDISASVVGRSKACDIIDCSIDTDIKTVPSALSWADIKVTSAGNQVSASAGGSQFLRVDVKKTIASLISTYGLSLKDRSLTGSLVVSDVSISKGTKVIDAIRTLTKRLNLYITDDEAGDLVLWSPRYISLATDAIVCNKDSVNVLEGSSDFDATNCFSIYEVFGQTTPDFDSNVPDVLYNVSGKWVSPAVKRKRALRIFDSGKGVTTATCFQRAIFEACRREAAMQTVKYTVQGWRQSSGALWKKGLTVTVDDSILDVHEQMIITSVTYNRSASGTTCTLSLAPVAVLLEVV